MNKSLSACALTLSLLVIVAASAVAQQHRFAAAPAPKADQSTEGPGAALVTIYSNLGPKNNVYNPNGGWIVAGPQDPYTKQQQDVAIPFTPASDSMVTKIAVPVQYYGYGKNAGTIQLAADASGLPGAVLASRDGTNGPTFGVGCCKLAIWTLASPVAVVAGTQYWIVATTDKKSIDSAYVWDYNWNGTISPIAVQDNLGGWNVLTFLTSPAAGVFGTLQ
ncbi:MAG: choice-of-anchor R domain-containing protein [Candidatus Sulfotelmatobacter sp.]